MTNFTVHFVYPWVLLLLVPALALVLFTYFRTPKKYRRTRNRVTALVLHVLVMALTITALSGITFEYDKQNTENELLLLVDLSDSNAQSEQAKNNFVRSVISQNGANKIGVVTFGYDQVYAAKLTNNKGEVYEKYRSAPKPDTSATDISAALKYASGLLTEGRSSKIVLISDGLQTDAHAENTIKSIAADGIRVDTVYFPTTFDSDEVQLTGATLPEYNIAVNDKFELSVSLYSSYKGSGEISLYDNDVPVGESKAVTFSEGAQSYTFEHAFALPGLHKLRFELDCAGDETSQNNIYYAYYYIETFENILVVARNEGDAENLRLLLSEQYTVKVVNVNDAAEMPSSLAELREYDQVVLSNIANSDMPDGFIDILYTYVHDLGGGLFTVGGSRLENGEKVANAYNRKDMYGTLYQEMLPVQAINYKPPIGLLIIIDRSGSMSNIDNISGKTKLEAAKDGARAALYALSDRDWVGVMSLSDDMEIANPMMPATRQNDVIAAIESIEIGGGTNYTSSLRYAGTVLSALTSVEKRHVILVSDGDPNDEQKYYSEPVRQNYANHGITFSMICVGATAKEQDLRDTVADGHGHFHMIGANGQSLSDAMRDELAMPDIVESADESVTPKVRDVTSVVNGLTNVTFPKLGGFYGVRTKSKADEPLVGQYKPSADGPYVPLYAQWRYGAGKVGSFMCDLTGLAGDWSAEFMADQHGRQFILNVINALFPAQSIRYNDLAVETNVDNYTSTLSVYTTVNELESVDADIAGPLPESDADSTAPNVQHLHRTHDDYSRIDFKTLAAGVYEVAVKKLDVDGNTVSQYRAFHTFSYSKEYDMFVDPKVGEELMISLAQSGRGKVITAPLEVFDDFEELLHKVIDPRTAMLIIALVLFLLGLAVRKFKWKWIHELVREHKDKKRDGEKR